MTSYCYIGMNKTHHQIISYIKEKSEDKTNALFLLSDYNLLRYMFINYRDNKGFRLTKDGYELVRKNFTEYIIQLHKETITIPHLIFLDNKIKFPYYIDLKDKILVVFDKLVATQINLCGKNLSTFMEIYDD